MGMPAGAESRTPPAERFVLVMCALLGAAFFTILAKGALFPQYGVVRAVLTTVAVGASILGWYAAGELIGRVFPGEPSITEARSTFSDALRLLAALVLCGLWYGMWLAGESVWRSLLAG